MSVSVRQIFSDDFLTKYDTLDSDLVASKDFVRNYGQNEDYVEAHIYSPDDMLLYSDYDYIGYKLPDVLKVDEITTVNSLIFDPVEHLNSLGYTTGLLKISYNILRKKVFDYPTKPFFIKEISSDRTEIRLGSNAASNVDIETGVLNFINEIQSAPYYKDFLLNFGDNILVNAVNIALDKATDNYTVLVKLYKPLPEEFSEKSSLWIVEELSESYTYEVEVTPEPFQEEIEFIRPANFDIDFRKDNNISSDYYNIVSLLSNSSLTAYQKLLSYISNKQVRLNVDFTNYSNFIHFSSARERLLNFVYKLELIESYQSNINSLGTITSGSFSTSVSASLNVNQDNINNIIAKFDDYEKYLYFESSSKAWPKSNAFPPYSLYPTTSSQAITWVGSYDSSSPYYGGELYSASIYDLDNQNNLNYSIPEFINIDDRNESFQLFINMIGQHFDNIWIYIKSISDIYDNRNNIEKGISRDLVYNVLQGLGLKLYNSSGNDNIFDYLIGTSVSGSYEPVSESYQTLITASAENLSGNDYNTELLKRLYHNVSYLLKTKGTSRGMKALVSTFGIPSTILDVSEYGGSDKNSETTEYTYDRYTYALASKSGSFFKMNWAPLTTNALKYNIFNRVADTVEVRFKPDLTNIKSRQTLLSIAKGTQERVSLWVDYTASNGIPSGKVTLSLSGSNGYVSQSFIAPIYATGSNGEARWWNTMIKRSASFNSNLTSNDQTYEFYVNDGDLNTSYSSSISFQGLSGSSYNYSWYDFGTTSSLCYLYLGGTDFTGSNINPGTYFNGQFQELRLWSEPLSEDAFIWHSLNPESIQGNTIDSAYSSLSARFTLGNNLLTYNHYLTGSLFSTHPNYSIYYSSGTFRDGMRYGYGIYGSGSYGDSGSFVFTISVNSGSFINFTNENNYIDFTETYYTTSPNAGYYSPVTEKVRVIDAVTDGYVLMPDNSIEVVPYYTKDVNFTDVSFSPQNEINKDIIAQYGSNLNIDDFIGNPIFQESSEYGDLVKLKNDYYKKFVSKYNYADYIKLIKYFDGSLFKMIKDFTPARTNIQTGVTIKSPILERVKVKRFSPDVTNDYNYYTASVGEVSFSADSDHVSNYGDGSDFFTGELSGSNLDVNLYFEERNYNPYLYLTGSFDEYAFEHSEYNVMLSNVSASVESVTRRHTDIVPNGVTYPAEIQDFYYKYKRHADPRYNGSRLTSAVYNKYTSGDISFDKQSNIDLVVNKFGWINKVSAKNINFYDKTTLSIKYLIDSSSNVYQLNKSNYNIFEVQNTFKSGDLVDVSLFNSFAPTNQINLQGFKRIWEGGFSFSPIVYRESNIPMQFDYITPTETYTTVIGIKGVSNKSILWQSFGNADRNIAARPADNVGKIAFTYGGSAQGDALALSSGPNSTWIYNSFVGFNFSGFIQFATFQEYFTYTAGGSRWYSLDWFMPFETGSGDGGYVTSQFINKISKVDNSSEKYVKIKVPATSNYSIDVSMPFNITLKNPDTGHSSFKLIGLLQRKEASSDTWNYLEKTKLEIITLPTNNRGRGGAVNTAESVIWVDTYDSHPLLSPTLSVRAVIRNFKTSLNVNDEIRIKFFVLEMDDLFFRSEDITITIPVGTSSDGYFEVKDADQSTIVPITSYTYTTSSFFTASANNYITFDNSASVLYNKTTFNNYGSNISSSYSEIADIFTIQPNDIIRFGSFFNLTPKYYTVKSVQEPNITFDANNNPTIVSPLRVLLRESFNPVEITQNNFAILRKKPDETSVILDYRKTEGETSKGILVPVNLRTDITRQTGNIIDPIKTTLLADE